METQGLTRPESMFTISSMQSPKLHQIQEALGRPTIATDNVIIYHGDALELLRLLPDSLIDLTVTSPPYNIGKQYENIRELGDYVSWCASWVRLIHAATAPSGAFWLNVGYLRIPGKAKAIPIPYLLWNHVDFYLIQEIVWNYGAGVASRKSFSPRNEKFLWYVKDEHEYTFNLDAVRDPNVKYPNQKKNGVLKCNPLGKNPTDVWDIFASDLSPAATDVWAVPKVTSGKNRSSKERTEHPAQFPFAVVDRIVKACSNPGDVVLDPFIGSGTVAEAALRNGCKVIGFEIHAAYVDIVQNRINNTFSSMKFDAAQQSLF